MIAHLTGTIINTGEACLVLDVNGVGYDIGLTQRDISNLSRENKVHIHIYTHVSENSLDLYGFVNEFDLSLFKQLITVSGVGPKMALSILNLDDSSAIASAIGRGDHTFLTKVSGVGKRTSERIVVELRDKVVSDDSMRGEENVGGRLNDVIDALVAMGYSKAQAREVVRGIEVGERQVEDLIREALTRVST